MGIFEVIPSSSLWAGRAAGSVAQAASPLGALQLPAVAKLLSGVGTKTRAFTYHFDRLAGDLPFYIEAGRSQSGACRITAVEPVELQPESPQVTVSAPPYANPEVHPKQRCGVGCRGREV